MKHEIFISHSARDAQAAAALCQFLEERDVKCWIAPRDIVPGKNWGESIINAIKRSKALVLILSSDSNASPQVAREVERAVNHAVPVVAVRIEEIDPSDALEYFLAPIQWLEAHRPPFESYLPTVLDKLQLLLKEARKGDVRGRAQPDARPGAKKPPGSTRPAAGASGPPPVAKAEPDPPPKPTRAGFPNPYDFDTVASLQTFKGRAAELDELVDSIVDGTHTAIFGLQRMGKTSLIEEGLAERLRDNPELARRIVLAKFDFQRLGEHVKYGELFRAIIVNIGDALAASGASKSGSELRGLTNELFRHNDSGDVSQLFLRFAQLLRGLSVSSGRQIVLFVDEFSEVRKAIEQHKKTQINNPQRARNVPPQELYVDHTFMRHLSSLMRDRELKRRFTLIVAVRPFMAEYDERESLQLLKLMKPIMLYHLDEKSARSLITEPVKGHLDYDPVVVEHMCRMTAGHPYLLQFVLKTLVDRVRRESRQRVTTEDLAWVESRMITEGPGYDAQFSVMISDYSVDEISIPQEKRLGLGTLALIAKIGHEQEGGWVFERQILDALITQRIPREKASSLLSQLLRARIVEERAAEGDLSYRMTIPLVRKRFVQQNLYLKFFR